MINRTRCDISNLLMDSPSLRPLVAAVVRDRTQRGREDLADWLAEHGGPPQIDIDSLTFTEDQVLDDWFPDDPVMIRFDAAVLTRMDRAALSRCQPVSVGSLYAQQGAGRGETDVVIAAT